MADMVNDSTRLREVRNAMRRSVERSAVRKALLDEIIEITDDICERYGILGAGDKASE